MTLASDNNFPKVILVEAAAPATPDAGEVKLYAKTDGLLYSKDDAGAETLVSGGPGAITTKDEGTPLSTAVTALDFVGAGVTAAGAGATTTVTIPGQLLADPGAVWAATTAYSLGDRVKDTATVVGEAGVAVFECVVAGTSAAANPFGWYPGYVYDGTVAWVYIGYIGGIDCRLAAPPVAYAHDGTAFAGPSASTDGAGNAFAGPYARAYGAGSAFASPTAVTDGVGDAYASPTAATDGAGDAYASPNAETWGAGNAYASPSAATDGAGDAYASPNAETWGAGSAYADTHAHARDAGNATTSSTARVDGTGTATAKIHAEYSTTKDAYVVVEATSAGANLAIHDGTSTGPGVLTSDGTHATWGRATYLDPTTATAHDIVDALIAAGLMAPS
jgi:hypothetical protein